jgi:hypothetical protein
MRGTVIHAPGDVRVEQRGHVMVHLAMWESLGEGTETEWGDHVTNDEYIGG